jgi:hypothetical protein
MRSTLLYRLSTVVAARAGAADPFDCRIDLVVIHRNLPDLCCAGGSQLVPHPRACLLAEERFHTAGDNDAGTDRIRGQATGVERLRV